MGENGVSVSLEDLDRAAEQPDPTLAEETPTKETPVDDKEAPKEESPKEEPVKDTLEEEPEEPTDNADRSKLGRRVSAIESSIQTLVDELRTIMKSAGKEEPGEDAELLSDEDENEYVTKKTLTGFYQKIRMQEAREAERAKSETDKYNSDYNSVFQELGKTVDAEIHTEVLQEMKAHHNFKRSTSGVLDAELNYLKAKDAVFQKKAAGPKNPLDKNKDKDTKNLGSPSDTIVTGKADTPVKLDKYAAEFVSRVGMSDDSVKRALDGNARTGLMGGKV